MKEVIPRSKYEYPQAVRAEAVALALSHRSYAEAEREMAKRYPKRHPSRDLIRLWVKKLEPDNFRELGQERNAQLAERSLDLALLTVDKLQAEVEDGGIKGKTLAITYGISTDKVLKIHELDLRNKQSDASLALAEAIERLADLSVPERDAIIEGEVIEGEARER